VHISVADENFSGIPSVVGTLVDLVVLIECFLFRQYWSFQYSI